MFNRLKSIYLGSELPISERLLRRSCFGHLVYAGRAETPTAAVASDRVSHGMAAGGEDMPSLYSLLPALA